MSDSPPALEHATLYVVDDDEAVRGSYAALLLSRGHAARAFADGEAFRPQHVERVMRLGEIRMRFLDDHAGLR